MAKSPSSKKKGAKAQRAKVGTFTDAMRALQGVGVPKEKVGQVSADGTVDIDRDKLEKLKEKLGPAAWSKVRFVALNAPFKRRSLIRPAKTSAL
jgi:hypothetical protein